MFVPLAFAVLLAAHLFDLLSFAVMTNRHGLEAEVNPLVVLLAEQLGLGGLTLVKLAAVYFGGAVFVLLIPHRRRLATLVVFFGIVTGLIGGLSNVATIHFF